MKSPFPGMDPFIDSMAPSAAEQLRAPVMLVGDPN
jgi:hypothetical protein